jgi:hypothetical protein
MPTRGRRALRLVSSTALAILALAGLAVAGAGVTNVRANTAAPSRAAGHLPTNRPTAGGSLVVALALGTSGTVGSVDPQLLAWSERHHVPVDAVQPAEVLPAFDAALEYLSTQTGRMTAVSAAKMIDYPVRQLRLADHTGWRIHVLLCLGLGLATCAAASPVAARRLLWRRCGAHHGGNPDHLTGARPWRHEQGGGIAGHRPAVDQGVETS